MGDTELQSDVSVVRMNNAQPKERKFPIMELFGPTIQGEGLMSGTVTHFLRTGGCGLRCSWCDSMFAVDPKQIKAGRTMMTTWEIIDAIAALPFAPYLTLTGGDPCLHKHLGELIMPLNKQGMRVAVETQGQEFPPWLMDCDVLTFSPKGPSSGNIVDPQALAQYCIALGKKRRQRVCIKVVIFDEHDFMYAMDVYRLIPPIYYDAFYFTAGTPIFQIPMYQLPQDEEDKAADMARRIDTILVQQYAIAEGLLAGCATNQFNDKVHVGCQQHVLLWPDKDKGV